MIKNLEALTLLAYQYAPFFFAVLFAIFITKHTCHAYSTAPPEQSQTYRWLFIAANTVGLILVIATSIWWFMNPPVPINSQPRIFTFKGQISGLKEYEEIASDDFYFRSYIPFHSNRSAPTQVRDEHFLVVQNKPFDNTTVFTVHFRKQGRKKQDHLSINYTLKEKPIYKVFYDHKNDKHVLKPISQEQTGSSLSPLESILFQTAYAQEVQHDHIDSEITSSSNDIKQRVIEARTGRENARLG